MYCLVNTTINSHEYKQVLPISGEGLQDEVCISKELITSIRKFTNSCYFYYVFYFYLTNLHYNV